MTALAQKSLVAIAIATTLIVVVAFAAQDSPSAIRRVIDARLAYCEDDGRFYRTGETGWIPTGSCMFPPAVPEVIRRQPPGG